MRLARARIADQQHVLLAPEVFPAQEFPHQRLVERIRSGNSE
jgi:hypothetical protein